MINLLLCGNKKVFDGALTELISIINKTKETINCYIFTMDVSRIKEDYVCIEDKQVEFLNKVVQAKNKDEIELAMKTLNDYSSPLAHKALDINISKALKEVSVNDNNL